MSAPGTPDPSAAPGYMLRSAPGTTLSGGNFNGLLSSDGGTMSVLSGSADIISTVFSSNGASASGGAVYIGDSTVAFHSSAFFDNSAIN